MIKRCRNGIYTWLPLLAFIAFFQGSERVLAQPPEGRFEAGAQIVGIRFAGLEEGAAGVGLNAGWKFNRWLTAETAFARMPENPSGNFGQTLIASGLRAGLSFSSMELAVKARPGGIHFGGDVFRAFNPDVRWKPSVDVGGVLLYHRSPRLAFRIDAGDLLIFYGSSVIATPLQPGRKLGATHNRQIAVGIQLRL